MFESATENAIDFLKTSLDELKGRPKYSVIHFCSAVEIFFKARLMAEHWSLVLAKPEVADLAKYQSGDFLSVTLDQAIARLENIAAEKLSKGAKSSFAKLREHRNKLVHFFHSDYIEPNESTLANIVSEQCRAWLHLHKLLTLQWKSHFEKYNKEIEELDRLMHQHREFLGVKFRSMENDLEALVTKGEKVIDCASCGFRSTHETKPNPPICESLCLVCGSAGSYLYIPCPFCSEEQIYSGHRSIDCLHCRMPITIEHIIDHYTPDECRQLPGEPEEDRIAYCHYCQHHTQSVVPLSNSWTCLACLEQHAPPGHCDWCNEFTTGDLDESFISGCSQCDGRVGWDA